jgi:NAD-dependent SIR2 family protein deacetylase
MLKNMVSPLEIHPAHVPRCPRCGGLLIPNLRCGDTFVEAPHIKNIERYEAFLKEAYGRNLVLLELGVGFNTPGIIRFPFEAMARQYPNTTLIRVNRDDAAMQRGKTARFVGIKEDVKTALRELVRMTSAEI